RPGGGDKDNGADGGTGRADAEEGARRGAAAARRAEEVAARIVDLDGQRRTPARVIVIDADGRHAGGEAELRVVRVVVGADEHAGVGAVLNDEERRGVARERSHRLDGEAGQDVAGLED